MTRKHFKRIAEELSNVRSQVVAVEGEDAWVALDAVDVVIHRMAAVCSEFNGNFDRDRFLTACGL